MKLKFNFTEEEMRIIRKHIGEDELLIKAFCLGAIKKAVKDLEPLKVVLTAEQAKAFDKILKAREEENGEDAKPINCG